ncbi:MAG: hypothetical protein WD208_05395 [Dehalococcoidia bacterium]
MALQEAPRRRRLLLAALLLPGLVGLVVLSVAIAMHTWSAEQVAATIERAEPWLLAWRIALCTALIVGWPWLIDRLRPWLPDANHIDLRQARWRVALWLVAVEMVLIQGVPAQLLRLVLP